MQLRNLVLISSLSVILVVALSSCTDEIIYKTITNIDTVICSDSTAPEWLFYYHYLDSDIDKDAITPIYSTKTLTAVDSLIYPGGYHGKDMLFTSDGQFILWGGFGLSEHIWCADAKTLDTLGIIHFGLGGKSTILSSNDNYVAGFIAGQRRIGIYSVPDLIPVWQDTIHRASTAIFLQQPERLIYTDWDNDSTIFVIDFLNTPSTVDSIVLTARDGNKLYDPAFGADHENDILYVCGRAAVLGDHEFLQLDMSNFNVISRFVIDEAQSITVSKSGNLVFLKNLCTRSVLLFRPDSKSLERFLDSNSVISPLFFPYILAVTPDDSILGIVTLEDCGGAQSSFQGHLMLINIQSKSILKVFYHNSGPGKSTALQVYPVSQ